MVQSIGTIRAVEGGGVGFTVEGNNFVTGAPDYRLAHPRLMAERPPAGSQEMRQDLPARLIKSCRVPNQKLNAPAVRYQQ